MENLTKQAEHSMAKTWIRLCAEHREILVSTIESMILNCVADRKMAQEDEALLLNYMNAQVAATRMK